ncbi:MAG: transposase [Candidatus Omnitrophica bacterium]|nr:transposase [Candidatus Omnitrophota bacterium]
MDTQNQVVEKETPSAPPGGAARLIRQVKRYTRKRFSAEEKIRIVLESFRKEMPVSDICRKEGVGTSLYYSWLKDFMEAGKSRLKGDSLRNATGGEVKRLKKENARLRELLAEYALENQLLKKSLNE